MSGEAHLADLLRIVHDESQELAARFKAALAALEAKDQPTVQIVNYAGSGTKIEDLLDQIT
jgi:hypothetical protein